MPREGWAFGPVWGADDGYVLGWPGRAREVERETRIHAEQRLEDLRSDLAGYQASAAAPRDELQGALAKGWIEVTEPAIRRLEAAIAFSRTVAP